MSTIVTEFDEQVDAAVESITVSAEDGSLIGVGWLDESGTWWLGAPRTGKCAPIKRGKRQVETLLNFYAQHYARTHTHGL